MKTVLMMISCLATLLALSSPALAASDLECTLSQSPQQASDNIAALLSRGFLAAGRQYISDGGGIDSNDQMSSSEHMELEHHLRLTHNRVGSVDSYSLSVEANSHMDDKKTFAAMLAVSEQAAKTLSKDDAAALMNCDHLLGQYIGVSPQPDQP
jgi:hypothetical protein